MGEYAADRGVIVLGIEDNGRIAGCSAKTEHLIETERRIRGDLCRDARFDAKRVMATTNQGETNYLLLIRVWYRDDKVVETNKGEAFIRRADTRHLLTPDERRELEIERGQVSFELEPCGLKYPDKFNMAAVKTWAANVRKSKRIEEAEQPFHQTLANHRLGRIDMRAMELPEPEFEQKEVGNTVVHVTLRNNQNVRERWVDSDVSAIVGHILADQMSDQEKRVVNFVAEHGKINVSEAMRLMPKPQWHNARALLEGLCVKGGLLHVRKFTRDPNAHYALNRPRPKAKA